MLRWLDHDTVDFTNERRDITATSKPLKKLDFRFVHKLLTQTNFQSFKLAFEAIQKEVYQGICILKQSLNVSALNHRSFKVISNVYMNEPIMSRDAIDGKTPKFC